MKKRLVFATLFCSLTLSPASRADLFGGDVVVLTQILIQAIQQLAQLRQIFGAARENIDLIRQINQGINDSLYFLKTIHPNLDPGVYRDWENVPESFQKLQSLYGEVPRSNDEVVQRNTDQSVAEAVSYNNAFYKYSAEIDQISEQIQSASHAVSPGGAQKLTAQALGLLIQVLNQNLRAQSTLLKLQAQDLALRNKQDKSDTQSFLDVSQSLSQALKREEVTFKVPRF